MNAVQPSLSAIIRDWIVISYLSNGREGNLHDLAIRDLDLDARSGEGLCCLHTADCSTHAPAVCGNNLDIVLAVQRL